MTGKLGLNVGAYLSELYHRYYYAKAQNPGFKLPQKYNDALDDVDVLAMTRRSNHPIGDSSLDSQERVEWSLNTFKNTYPLNLTGHPAIRVPVV